MKPFTLSLFFSLIVLSLSAQDPHFTQPMAAPVYYNPAFAGTAQKARISTAYRNQWSSISSGYQTYNVSYDQQCNALAGGVPPPGLLTMGAGAFF
ncbi:MAG: type IX secretion system membrane protein PorP/SprF [Bacteroidia bacterium]